MAIRTGIPFEVWRDCDDPRVVPTAFELLFEEDRRAAGGSDRVVMSGGG